MSNDDNTVKVGIYSIYLTCIAAVALVGSGFIAFKAFLAITSYTSGKELSLLISPILFTPCLFFYLSYKTRLLLVYKDRIRILSMFPSRRILIYFSEIQDLQWDKFYGKGTLFKSVKLIAGDSRSIEFSDYEFENFNDMIEFTLRQTKFKFPEKLYHEQAKENNTMNLLGIILLIVIFGMFIFMKVEQDDSAPLAIPIICSALFLFATVKRQLNYMKWL